MNNIKDSIFPAQALESCHFAKMILMMCVILCHSCAFWTAKWFTAITPILNCPQVGYFGNWFGTFQIPAFVLISGYIYSYIKLEKGGYYSRKLFVINKIKRLLIPYFFVTLVWLIPLSYVFHNYTVYDVLFKYLVEGGEQLWFLYMLFWVFVIFDFFLSFFIRNFYCGLALIACSYVVGYILFLKSINHFQIATSFQYLLYFWLGFYLRIFHIKGRYRLTKPSVLILVVFIHVVAYLLFLSPFIHGKAIIQIFLNVYGSLMAFVVLIGLGQHIKWGGRFLQMIKGNSFTMYLFHQQIIYFSLYLLNGLLYPELHAVVNFIFSFGISLIISILLNKYKLTRILLGNK